VKLKFFTEGVKVSRREFAAATLLLSGTIAWFFLLNQYLLDIFTNMTPNEPLWNFYNVGWILFYGSSIFFAIVGSFVGRGISRRKLLFAWIFLGFFSTIVLTLFHGSMFLLISSLLLGVSLGLGLPISMAFVGDITVIEERARVCGVIILGSFVLAFVAMGAVRTLSLGLEAAVVLFAVVRLTSLLALFNDKLDAGSHKIVEGARLSRAAYREFGLYLFPWVIFSIASGLAFNLIPLTADFESAVMLGSNLRYVFIAVFGAVSGFVADRVGRKWPIIVGLIILAISFALLGVSMSPSSVLVYLTVSGIAWGLFFVIFLAVPSDLSVLGSREKFYAIGYILPLGILFGESAIPGSAILSRFSASSLAQIFSIMLFLSIIPIWVSKETLPKEKVQERKMKEHLEKIKELLQDNREK
jgi:MFS family permease